MNRAISRRSFIKGTSAVAAASIIAEAAGVEKSEQHSMSLATDGVQIDDKGWSLWLDRSAGWQDDIIYLPDSFSLEDLPVNQPTGGWQALFARMGGEEFRTVQLPTTVEEHLWGRFGTRPYDSMEYFYAKENSNPGKDDDVPQNGAYRGVSWFYRTINIPTTLKGRRILLDIRSARMRAEIYLNGHLTGYSILEELPFTCDITSAVRPGGVNQLAIRITNPGGRYDWHDGKTIRWGKVELYRSHGFGGLDRGLVLRSVPWEGHIEDVWVLNTPAPRTVGLRLKLSCQSSSEVRFEVLDPASGRIVATSSALPAPKDSPDGAQLVGNITLPQADLWDLDAPKLYQLRTTVELPGGEKDVRHVTFGFRSYGPDGLGRDAIFRLNGRRVKIYTAISWGFWGYNGLFPTQQLAEREVSQAKRLNLNCLNFHRNIGKEEVLNAHDRLGVLRYMEPGGGRFSISRPSDASSDPDLAAATRFSREYMTLKCRQMVRAFRSHPSLVQYTLQNEFDGDLKNAETFQILEIMHAEDPSRCVLLNDGFTPPPKNQAQAWFAPYDETIHRSDREQDGGWWNNHQGAADQWYDRLYKDPANFTYRKPLNTVLVEWGEMEGCAVADNHPLMIHQIETKQFGGSGSSYDFVDHQQIAAAYDRFFNRWGFRNAFPASESFFKALGNKSYESWQQYMENVRICDQVDFCAISGWESTAIENHSGIVDNLRNFKGDPDLIASSLQPLRPVAKQRALTVTKGEAAVFDLYLLNETGRTPQGRLSLEMVDPGNNRLTLASFDPPAVTKDQFSYLVKAEFRTRPLGMGGSYRFVFRLDAAPLSTFDREIWVVDPGSVGPKPLKVGVSGATETIRRQLSLISGVQAEPFDARNVYDVIVASGIVPGSRMDRQIGDETGTEPDKPGLASKVPPGCIPDEVLAAVHKGTPLLAAVPDDFLADGVARQIAALGALTYRGQVGNIRAPWMGNWSFVRSHPTFEGLPTDGVLSIHYQASGKQSNGLLIESVAGSPDPEVIMGYSRDHDRNIGAASFICYVGGTPVLLHRAPDFSAPLQTRWLTNALKYMRDKRSDPKRI